MKSRTTTRTPSRLEHLDVALVAATMLITLIGLVAVYSATKVRLAAAHLNPHSFLERQATWVLLGTVVMTVIAAYDYRRLAEHATLAYGAVIVSLLAVLSPVGAAAKGSQRWFPLGPLQLQPSSFAAIAVIIMTAAHCQHRDERLEGRGLLFVLALTGIPMALVAVQPDLGTALVLAAATLATLTVAGISLRQAVVLGLLAVAAVVLTAKTGVLKDYQLHRLTAFVHQSGDVQGLTYNVQQSKITIGSGGLLGRGLFHGPQTNLAYVPEQQTDFIFTAIGEQLGLLGSVAVLALFGIVAWRIHHAAQVARDQLGTLLCVGVLGLVVFEVFENVGMTLGIMPVAGIPLPLISYGGSATIATMAGIGLVISVHLHRFR